MKERVIYKERKNTNCEKWDAFWRSMEEEIFFLYG